ncbi:uncharacterized protein LTR77_002214 [Saxophila tyrrhenica]|uniref:Uncharacterized protein n=1 Tax=Saxophila tyrrhenica TaxID=1690608 RepID=A0AAV9PLD2_9PEZI|nr:hypothetical protein LTR77_002214 [Saxophila tyrrhenica]
MGTIAARLSLDDLIDREKKLHLYFCVHDTGPGLTTEQIGRLFHRYSQATPKTHVTYGGSGLGLYICRELAEKQGGGVGVASHPDKGSAFAFWIETRAVATPEEAAAGLSGRLSKPLSISRAGSLEFSTTSHSSQDLSHRPGLESKRTINRHQGGFHILLVEDNLVNQRILTKQLETAQCTVTVANNGEEALSILEKSNISQNIEQPPHSTSDKDADLISTDLILMDIEMPVMDGLQCTRRTREFELAGQISRHLPIIAVTANVRQELKDAALAAGVDSVLSKPCTVSDVLVRVEEHLVESPRLR